MATVKQTFLKTCEELAKLDISRLISRLQKHHLWNNYDYTNRFPFSMSYIMEFVDSIVIDDENKFKTIIYEIKNLIKDFNNVEPKIKNHNFHRRKLEKQIKDYELKIEELRGLTTNFRKNLLALDTETVNKQFEAYTAEWAATEEKIYLLTLQKNVLKKKLLPPETINPN